MDIKELILKAKELQGIEVKEEIVEEQKYGVMSIPTLYIYKDGKELTHNTGFITKEEIVEEQKANEVMHTTNTGFWKETVPVNVLLDPALDMLPKYSSLINLLPGNHGNNMPISAKVPVIGDKPHYCQYNMSSLIYLKILIHIL